MGAAAEAVIAALRKSSHFDEKAHAWLQEVRSRTGYGGGRSEHERYADALVFSLWPSRGLWVAGIEVKVQRRDWQLELRTPEKSASHQQFCDYWWVATTPGVVRPGEVPEQWGHVEVEPKRVRVIKQAPKLKPAPFSREILASIMRKHTSHIDAAYERGSVEGYDRARKTHGTERVEELEKKVRDLSTESSGRYYEEQRLRRELAQLKAGIAAFEQAAGLEPGTVTQVQGAGFGRTGSYFATARTLAELHPRALAERLREAAVALDKLPSVEGE